MILYKVLKNLNVIGFLVSDKKLLKQAFFKF